MLIFLLSESPESFSNLLSQKFAQMRVTAGHFTMKIAVAMLLEVGKDLRAFHLALPALTMRSSLERAEPRGLLSGSPCKYTDN